MKINIKQYSSKDTAGTEVHHSNLLQEAIFYQESEQTASFLTKFM